MIFLAAAVVFVLALFASSRVRPSSGGARDTVWGFAFFFSMPLGMLVSFLSPMRRLQDAMICGPGDRMVERGCGRGGCLKCEAHPDTWVLAHYVSCILLVFSALALAGLIVVALRKQPPAAAGGSR